MHHRNSRRYLLALLLLPGSVVCGGEAQTTNPWKPEIPKTWVDDELTNLELPLANPTRSPKHISGEYYYRIPVRPIYKSYPIYAPGKEPPGYLERLGSSNRRSPLTPQSLEPSKTGSGLERSPLMPQ